MSKKELINLNTVDSSKVYKKAHQTLKSLSLNPNHSQLSKNIIKAIKASNTTSFLVHLKQQNYTNGTINIMMESLVNLGLFLSSSSIEDYRDFLIENVKPTTANLRIYCVNKYLNYIGIQYAIRCVAVQSKKVLDKVISLKSYNKLKDYYIAENNMEIYYAVKVLASTGMRPSELFKIRYEDISIGYVDIYSKRNKQRRIFFPKPLVKEMSSYYNIKNMTNIEDNIFKFSIAHLRYEIRKGVECGIDRKELYPYSFRHLYAKTFLKKSKNITLLADILGHESLETTRIYTRLTKEEQAQEVNRIVDWG